MTDPFGAGEMESRKIVGYVTVSSELLAPDLLAQLEDAWDRQFRPWRYPDRNPFPTVVLFPRLARVSRVLRRLRR